MKKRKPLTDEEGEVRELMMEDIRRFRPMTESLSPSLAAKLGVRLAGGDAPATRAERVPRTGKPMGKLEAIYRALLERPRADNDEIAELANRYADEQVSIGTVGNRRGEVRWMLRELERLGWLTPQAVQQIKPLVGD